MVFTHVVIVNLIQIDLVSQVFFHEVVTKIVTKIVTQSNDGFYCDRFSIDMFILITMTVSICLHK
jgi:hypothetical protein